MGQMQPISARCRRIAIDVPTGVVDADEPVRNTIKDAHGTPNARTAAQLDER
ncbi:MULTISPECIES: hypothetical protein [unclassified Streptomyces]|uniref:hypothetical protein n=1 Tax=unclassified Streptomyces TaxID=2593676 RepID=UPI0015A07CC4|nr:MULTISPECIES: hypothetical protein [unclassified Streptomyces]